MSIIDFMRSPRERNEIARAQLEAQLGMERAQREMAKASEQVASYTSFDTAHVTAHDMSYEERYEMEARHTIERANRAMQRPVSYMEDRARQESREALISYGSSPAVHSIDDVEYVITRDIESGTTTVSRVDGETMWDTAPADPPMEQPIELTEVCDEELNNCKTIW